MQHFVAVRADRTHVAARHNSVCSADLGDRNEVVDMDEPLSYVAIGCLEVKAAYGTTATKEPDTFLARPKITLVPVHSDGAAAAFHKLVCVDF